MKDSKGLSSIANNSAEKPDTKPAKIQHTNISNLIVPTKPLLGWRSFKVSKPFYILLRMFQGEEVEHVYTVYSACI